MVISTLDKILNRGQLVETEKCVIKKFIISSKCNHYSQTLSMLWLWSTYAGLIYSPIALKEIKGYY